MSEILPLAWKVCRWSEDPLSKGSWSQLLVNGTTFDREVLGTQLSPSLVFAGEHASVDFPAMIQGAWSSGIAAASKVISCSNFQGETDEVIVIGAGFAGIAAAVQLNKIGVENVTILEGRDRIGGRVHSHLGAKSPSSVDIADNTDSSDTKRDILVDCGASWLHHCSTNPLFREAKRLNLNLVPCDFNKVLSVASDGPVDNDIICNIHEELATFFAWKTESQDCSVSEALDLFFSENTSDDIRHIQYAVADMLSESSVELTKLSACNGLNEPGGGCDDYICVDGLQTLLEKLAEENNLRVGGSFLLKKIVSKICWGVGADVKIITTDGMQYFCKRCICSVPVSILQDQTIIFEPELPSHFLEALLHIELGHCDKVILTYESRWWPQSNGHILRWYGKVGCHTDASNMAHTSTYVDWVDLTDCVGYPCIAAFLSGASLIQKYHTGKSDQEIAYFASKELESLTLANKFYEQ